MPITPSIAKAIEERVDQLCLLASQGPASELDRLRDETASLQAVIAEARRLQFRQRRLESQGAAVLFPVLIESGEFVGYSLVTSLSADGLRAKASATLSRPQPVRVHFTSRDLIEGTIVWSDSRELGIQFERSIDVLSVLSGTDNVEAEVTPRRPARLPLRCDVEINVGKRSQYAEVWDISQRGAKVLTNVGRPGMKTLVQVGGLPWRKASFQWNNAGLAGLKFAEPLSFRELARFGQTVQTGL